jgi:hypothetical protein
VLLLGDRSAIAEHQRNWAISYFYLSLAESDRITVVLR